jgi:hypothetical protein
MTMTVEQYFGPWIKHPDATPKRKDNAARLMLAVARLEAHAVADGVVFRINPKTGSGVSGKQYGGFRPQDCPEGAPGSSHKDALAVDRYDPIGEIDAWCLRNLDVLELCGIYIEHPSETCGWSHWTIRAPKSGRRVFFP